MTTQEETLRPAFAGREEPRISYGIAFPEAAARHTKQLFHASKVYVICSGSLARNTDALDRLKAALGEEKKVVGVRIGMKPHTLWSEVVEIANEARDAGADLLVTLGAGTLTDAAKIVSFALANDVSTLEGINTLTDEGRASSKEATKGSKVPIISIPTSLSAGEYSDFAGGTNDQTHRKHSFQAPLLGPRLIILDPKLTATTPDSIWLSTGIRAVDHCVEILCSNVYYEETDQYAVKALGMLVSGLLRCKQNRNDFAARLDCQLGSVEAMAACTHVKKIVQVGASHGIGHQLGPLGVGHGETSCILLPAVCRFNAAKGANVARQEQLYKFLTEQETVRDVMSKYGTDPGSSDLADLLDVVIRELGMPRSLKAVGVGRDKLDVVAKNSLDDRCCKSNPVPLTEKEQVLEILEMVVGE
ncbi:hypothetical protein UA08_05626 [Talaromyces atroroseus]|uniref:Uncharacterized protein n=1 Tax=Talaromyces atroroseus TaxID=1441469 RepID=A0A225AEU9_TALAT|nr:hypothetical protein UA08_05626 [Talaromyces atroroseus]OKL59080.1 hypothetical protein UA08_05626 [Talaromyces atroroseus]